MLLVPNHAIIVEQPCMHAQAQFWSKFKSTARVYHSVYDYDSCDFWGYGYLHVMWNHNLDVLRLKKSIKRSRNQPVRGIAGINYVMNFIRSILFTFGLNAHWIQFNRSVDWSQKGNIWYKKLSQFCGSIFNLTTPTVASFCQTSNGLT